MAAVVGMIQKVVMYKIADVSVMRSVGIGWIAAQMLINQNYATLVSLPMHS